MDTTKLLRFDPAISLGHILQIIILTITLIGGGVTLYTTMQSNIAQIRSDITLRLAEHEYKINSIEHNYSDLQDENKKFQTDIKDAIAHITDILTDVRITVGKIVIPVFPEKKK